MNKDAYVYEALKAPQQLESSHPQGSIRRFLQRSLKSHDSTPVHVTIRLLHLEPGHGSEQLQCRLTQTSLFDVPAYEALSYTWGAANDTRTILCDGKSLEISRSLFTALSYLRYPDRPRVIWADAVCIDQGNVDERNEQVQAMRHIYAGARRVQIWLGEASERDADAMAMVQWLHRRVPVYARVREQGFLSASSQAMEDATSDAAFGAASWTQLVNLFTRSWFERVWVIQEVVKASEAHVSCGTETVRWEWLETVAVNLSMNKGMLCTKIGIPVSELKTSNLLIACLLKHAAYPMPLFRVLCYTQEKKCTDARDRLYGFFGLSGLREEYDAKPDYRLRFEDVYRNYTILVLQHGSLNHLHCASYLSSFARSPSRDLPSWVVDWTKTLDVTPFAAYDVPYDAAKGTQPSIQISADKSALRIRGKLLDTIKATSDAHPGWLESSVIDFPPATQPVCAPSEPAWLDQCFQLHAASTTLSLADACNSDDPEHAPLLDAFIRTLICGLSRPRLAPASAEYIDQVRSALQTTLTPAEAGESSAQSASYPPRFLQENIEWATRRRFCTTAATGRHGWVPLAAAEGDVVCVLGGGKTPFVLRPCCTTAGNDGGDADADADAEGRFTLVGECYLEGVMYGEGMGDEGIAEREFRVL